MHIRSTPGRQAQPDPVNPTPKRNGYTQCPNTPCLFRHHTGEIMFCLVVDDFGVRYKSQADTDHIISTLEKYYYKLKVRSLGDVYLRMAIAFDQPNKTVSISMPGYVKKMLQRCRPQYLLPGHRPTKIPGVYIAPSLSKKPQTVFIDRLEKPSPALVTHLQATRYYRNKLLLEHYSITPALSIPLFSRLPTNSHHSRRTLPDESSTRPIALSVTAPPTVGSNQIVYPTCDMVLHVFVDASYLCRSRARSVAGAIFFLGNHNDPTSINGSIHVFSSMIPCVVASAGEAQYAALFAAGQHAASIRTTLSDMGYPQGPTIIMCDNTSAIGIATDSIKQKRSKAIDMRFHWIRDRVRQSLYYCVYSYVTKFGRLLHQEPAISTTCTVSSCLSLHADKRFRNPSIILNHKFQSRVC
jgi:hypothetical protein